MTNINNKLNRLVNTKNKLKNVINYSTPNIITEETSFKEYPKKIKKEFVKIVNNGTDELYNNLPKTTKEGTKITLNGETAQMGIVPKGNMDNFIRLPSEYTQVDYIEGHRAEYIDTGFKVTPKTKIEATFAFNQVTPVQQRIFGNGYSETDGLVFTTYINGGGNFAWCCQNNIGNWQNTGIKADTNKHTFTIDSLNKVVTMDDRYNTTITTTRTNNSINTMLLFSYRGDGTTPDNFPYLKMYSTKIYNNNTLIRDFIPCFRNSDNEVGMYDIINNIFYTNQGTGAFTYGNVVEIFTPDHSQNIKTVTGEQNIEIKGKNLFDKNNMNILNGYLWQNQMVLKDTYTDRIFYIPCQPNTTYTISREVLTNNFRVATYNDTIPVVTSEKIAYPCYNEINNNNGKSITITTDNNTKYLLVMYANTNNDNNIEESVATIQIEKNLVATKYESYYKSQNYQINLGKNLFDKNNANIINAYTSSTLVNSPTSSTIYIKCNPNTTYTISRQLIGKRFQVAECDVLPTIGVSLNNLTPSSFENELSSITITTSSTAKYLCVFYSNINNYDGKIYPNNNGYSEEELRSSLQIETDSKATEYTSYFEPIELYKIKDYQDYIYYNNEKWYLHKEIGKAILNGGSNESYNYQNNHRFWLRHSFWTNETVPFNPLQNTLQGLYCNRFIERTRGQTWTGIEGVSYDNPNTTNQPIGSTFDIACNSIATNENDFKIWLSSNNLIIYYILQNPQEIEITNETLINQLENIKNNAYSYLETTIVECNSSGENNANLIVNASVLKNKKDW